MDSKACISIGEEVRLGDLWDQVIILLVGLLHSNPPNSQEKGR